MGVDLRPYRLLDSHTSKTEKKGVASAMLRKRIAKLDKGERVIPRVEQVTFNEAAQSLVDEYTTTGKKSLDDLTRRINLHLKPFFGGRRLVSIGAEDVRKYKKARQAERIIVRRAKLAEDGTILEPAITKTTSPAQVNRELAILKSIFTLAIRDEKIGSRPHITMLREDNVRTGFFERDQFDAVVLELPEELRNLITFAYVTGWRIASEIMPLRWSQVDRQAGEVRLNAGTTKNDKGRVFPFAVTKEATSPLSAGASMLRRVIEEQWAKHKALTSGKTVDLKDAEFEFVFFRLTAEERGGRKRPESIKSITKAWRNACRAAKVADRIPHDMWRTAVRNLVRAGVPESVAMKLTGHKTRSVFDRYDISSADDLRDAVSKLDAFIDERRQSGR